MKFAIVFKQSRTHGQTDQAATVRAVRSNRPEPRQKPVGWLSQWEYAKFLNPMASDRHGL